MELFVQSECQRRSFIDEIASRLKSFTPGFSYRGFKCCVADKLEGSRDLNNHGIIKIDCD